MAVKQRNARRLVAPNTRYINELRLDIEIDQGYPLTTAQDKALNEMAAQGNVTVQVAAERLRALRPKPKP
jgi:hypothetical protein